MPCINPYCVPYKNRQFPGPEITTLSPRPWGRRVPPRTDATFQWWPAACGESLPESHLQRSSHRAPGPWHFPKPHLVALWMKDLFGKKNTVGSYESQNFWMDIHIILMDIHILFIWRSGHDFSDVKKNVHHFSFRMGPPNYKLVYKPILTSINYYPVSGGFIQLFFFAVNIATLDDWWLTFRFHIVSVEVFQTKNDRQGFPSNVVFFDSSYSLFLAWMIGGSSTDVGDLLRSSMSDQHQKILATCLIKWCIEHDLQ